MKQKWMYYHLSANRNRYHFEDWKVDKSLRICLNMTPAAIPSNLQIANSDSRKRSDLSVLEFGGKTWLSFTTFIFMENVCYIVILNLSWIMEYDRAFLIDKQSPQHWSITFQLQQALRLLELFFSEKWPKTFHLFGEITGKSSEKNTKLGLTVFFGIPLNTYA